MRLEFSTQAEAQAKQDEIHARMIAADPVYAASVKAGQTLRWAIPYQDKDADGKIIGSSWWVNVKDRCDAVLTAPEQTALKPFRTKAA